MSREVPIDTRAKTAKELRKLRRNRMLLRLLIGVGLPTLLASIYYLGIATPQFESYSGFTIQSADGGGPSSLQLLVASVPGNASSRDVRIAEQYIRSRDMLGHLLESHGYLEHYSAGDIDFISRLDSEANDEELFAHYNEVVSLEHDDQSGVLTLRVRAFDAEKAAALAQAILDASETMVNELSETARSDRMNTARTELTRAEERLGAARQRIVELQGERSELNPLSSAQSVLAVRGGLEAELASARAELSALRATLQPTAPAVIAQRRRVNALAAQVNRQARRLTGEGETEGGLSETIAAFEPAMAEKEFAERAYASALTGLELARVDANRQHRYLVTVARPSSPDAPTYPAPFRSIFTVFVFAFAFLGIGTLLLASLREHANV